MDLLDFIPFRTEMAKAYHGLTGNATHTSENPVFSELKVRRYERPASELTEFITTKIDHWIGWELRNEKKAVGGMSVIRADASSFALLGMKIQVVFGLFEEKDASGGTITTVNAKAETQIDSKGDLGESRRMIRMMLGALDFEFRRDMVREEEYRMRIADASDSSQAFQHLFNEAKIQREKQPSGKVKGKPIEFKKNPVRKQTIELKKSSATKQSIPFTPSSRSQATAPEAAVASNGSSTEQAAGQPKASRPKVTIVTKKK